jgi:hypothetical protein
MPHVDRRTIPLKRTFDDFDGPIDTCTKPARLRKQGLCHA